MKSLFIALLVAVAALCASAEDAVTKLQLPATVTVTTVTNVVSGDNSSGCQSCFAGGLQVQHLVYGVPPCQPYKPATERWTITNIVRRVALVTEWEGKQLQHVEETVTSSITNRWKLASEWKKE